MRRATSAGRAVFSVRVNIHEEEFVSVLGSGDKQQRFAVGTEARPAIPAVNLGELLNASGFRIKEREVPVVFLFWAAAVFGPRKKARKRPFGLKAPTLVVIGV